MEVVQGLTKGSFTLRFVLKLVSCINTVLEFLTLMANETMKTLYSTNLCT